MITNCLIINMDTRRDLWDKLALFRKEWINAGNSCHRISGTNYKDKTNILNDYIQSNRINLNGTGFRDNKSSFLGELGCYDSHYKCWKYIEDNNLKYCLILEDGIEILRHDFKNITVNENIDLLYVNEEMKINGNNEFIGYGLQGYVLSYNGAKILLNLCNTLICPIDLQLRNVCNSKNISASALYDPFVKRDHNRCSSIEGRVLNDLNNLNDKQNTHSIIQRIIINLLKMGVNLDQYI